MTEEESNRWPRWSTASGVSDLSVAIDEIYLLRAILADEARILEDHTKFKSFPKSRRKFATDSIRRMRAAARGDLVAAVRNSLDAKQALVDVDADQCLTNHQWAESRNLKRVNE